MYLRGPLEYVGHWNHKYLKLGLNNEMSARFYAFPAFIVLVFPGFKSFSAPNPRYKKATNKKGGFQ